MVNEFYATFSFVSSDFLSLHPEKTVQNDSKSPVHSVSYFKRFLLTILTAEATTQCFLAHLLIIILFSYYVHLLVGNFLSATQFSVTFLVADEPSCTLYKLAEL